MTTIHRYEFSSCDLLPDEYRTMVAECAYKKAREKGVLTSRELEDWLKAEQEIKNLNFYRFQT